MSKKNRQPMNKVEHIKIGGKWFRLFTIRELFCYRHPTYGHIVKKSYENQSIMTTGRVSPRKDVQARLIESQKRKIERMNTKATALDCRPITEYWWEPPGPTGRFDDDGNPL
jgi:hypothetical protein